MLELMQNRHITPSALEALADGCLSGELTAEDRLTLTTHLEHCPYCMVRFEDALCALPLESPPVGLETAILEAAKRPVKPSWQVVFFQAAKLAACIALTMALFWGGVFQTLSDTMTNAMASFTTFTEQKNESAWTQWTDSLQKEFQSMTNQLFSYFKGDDAT